MPLSEVSLALSTATPLIQLLLPLGTAGQNMKPDLLEDDAEHVSRMICCRSLKLF